MGEAPLDIGRWFNTAEIGFSYHKGIRDSRGFLADIEFIDVNPFFERLLGADRNRIIGCRAGTILPPRFRATPDWVALFVNEEPGRSYHQCWLKFPDTDSSFMSLSFKSVQGQPDLFFTFLFKTDGTGGPPPELEKREERWRYALEGGGVGVWDINGETGEVYYSPIWKKMLGYEDYEIGSTNDEWESRIHPEDRETIFVAIRLEQLRKAPISRHEHRLRCKDGSYKWILSLGKTIKSSPEGQCLRAVGIHIDIGERKQIEESLKQREQELRVILETTKDGFCSTDKSGKFLSANEAFLHMIGYSLEELLTLRFADLSVFQTEEELDARNHRIETNGFEVFETRWRLKNGKTAFFEISASLLDTHPRKIVYFCRDTTERKNMEDQLLLAKKQAEAANQAKTRFLSTISHELRNPLNSILGFTQLLFDSSLTPEQQEHTRYIASSSRLLLNIIGEVLDLSKIEAGKMALAVFPSDLRKVCAEVVQLHLLQAKEKSIDLRWNFDELIPESLLFDPFRLQQVLMNLIGNAVKFTSAGNVSLRVSRRDPQRYDGKEFIRFEIEDSGIGMSEEACNRVFSEYEQADPMISQRYGGTGLGLAISKKILDLMGSSLRVKSALGVGSVFSFDLPLVMPKKHHRNETLAVPAEEPKFGIGLKRRVHVLLVEDEPVNLLLSKKLLSKISPELTFNQATNGEEALEIFLKSPPDIIFMDIHMPVMDGYQTTVKIRLFEKQFGSHVPIIGVTAVVGKKHLEDCLSSGMDDVLLKPLSTAAFEKMLRKWLLS
ncbi:MAG TPA: PAS domain S-box protein [Thermotogota bacterium]|nr:PAS domain S-box protein [Thermotogota bacterium]HOZ12386.1 PAS domain S-box protein [Thermotogota bacterium]HQN22561.1 PAS domain S-box protein [Thermotogota bacterium]HQQ65969.1 PAS domain S-box protein [Thermotogota bacterium]